MENDDLEKDILAAFDEMDKGDAAPAPVVDAPTESSAPLTEAEQLKIDATGRAHAKDGKFTNKPGEGEPAPEPAVDPAVAVAQPATDPAKPATTALQPHSHWAPHLKAAFLQMPAEAQQALLDREADMDKGRNEWAGKAEEYNQFKPVLDQHRDRWAVMGMNPATAITRLLDAERAITNDPVTGIGHLLSNYHRGNEMAVISKIIAPYGLALVQSDNQGDEPPQGHQPSQAAPTAQQIEALVQQRVNQALSNRDAEAGRANMMSEVEAVRKDPKNLFFENVKAEVAALAARAVDNGDKRSYREIVQDSYDKAVWANPTTRQLVMQADQRARDEATRAAAAEKAKAARQAAGSITGSPQVDAPAARTTGSTNRNLEADIRADVEAAWEAIRA